METKIAEIADGIFRLSTYVPQIAPPAGFAFNSFLVRGEQPLLFHTGLHKMFLLNREEVAHGATGCLVSLNDMAVREPRILGDGEVIDLGGGKRVRYIDTPHTPHGWDAGVMYEESTGTLLCGDLFTQLGDNPALVHGGDIVGPAIAGEETFQYSALNPEMATSIRNLAKLAPKTLALMHGPSFAGDGKAALNALASFYEDRTLSRRMQIAESKAA